MQTARKRSQGKAGFLGAGKPWVAKNALKHGLLSRLRPADDVEGLARKLWADFSSQAPADDAELWHAVEELAAAELAVARVRERQRAADLLMADMLVSGDLCCDRDARILASFLCMPVSNLPPEGSGEISHRIAQMSGVTADPLDAALGDRRILRRYLQETGGRRHRAMQAVLSLLTGSRTENREMP